MLKQTLNIKGEIIDLSQKALIMGIVNLTPDSFYAGSRCALTDLEQRLRQIEQEGGDIVDIGAYSSRPNAEHISQEEERKRLRPALDFIRKEMPHLRVSVDTFRADIARECVEEYGVSIINDISGGALDETMFDTVAKLQVPYILMHLRGTPQTMQDNTVYQDLSLEVCNYFVKRLDSLREKGLHDIILDLGFGFGKSLEQNYELLAEMPRIQELLGEPMLVGISRKSMIYKALDITAEEALNGTTVLHTYALMNGANILRVHDVKEAVQCRQLCELIPTLEAENKIERFYKSELNKS